MRKKTSPQKKEKKETDIKIKIFGIGGGGNSIVSEVS